MKLKLEKKQYEGTDIDYIVLSAGKDSLHLEVKEFEALRFLLKVMKSQFETIRLVELDVK